MNAEKPQPIKKLRPAHLRMADYIMANPGCTYEQISAELGYTIGWISQIYNSDAFQALLAERQIEVFGELKMTIRDRVVGLGHVALKRLEERVPVETDVDKITNVADLALKALGFGPKAGAQAPSQQTNVIIGTVDPATLREARSLMHRAAGSERVIEPEESPPALEQK